MMNKFCINLNVYGDNIDKFFIDGFTPKETVDHISNKYGLDSFILSRNDGY